jgi:hypothetical protein
MQDFPLLVNWLMQRVRLAGPLDPTRALEVNDDVVLSFLSMHVGSGIVCRRGRCGYSEGSPLLFVTASSFLACAYAVDNIRQPYSECLFAEPPENGESVADALKRNAECAALPELVLDPALSA